MNGGININLELHNTEYHTIHGYAEDSGAVTPQWKSHVTLRT